MVLQRDSNLQQYRRTLPILQVLTSPVHRFFHRLPRHYSWGEPDVCNLGLRCVLDSSMCRGTLKDRVLEAFLLISNRSTLSELRQSIQLALLVSIFIMTYIMHILESMAIYEYNNHHTPRLLLRKGDRKTRQLHYHILEDLLLVDGRVFRKHLSAIIAPPASQLP